MPVVTITLFPGRNDDTKELIAREVSAAIAEHTRTSVDGTIVLFDEKTRSQWVKGTVIAAKKTPPAQPPNRVDRIDVDILRVPVEAVDALVRIVREVTQPALQAVPGFISQRLVQVTGEVDEWLVVTQWLDAADADAYKAGAIHAEFRRQLERIGVVVTSERAGTNLHYLDPLPEG